MNSLRGWPFEPLDGFPSDTTCGGGESGGGSPG
jgi:hypothetical protein